jgi:hypothetical protein
MACCRVNFTLLLLCTKFSSPGFVKSKYKLYVKFSFYVTENTTCFLYKKQFLFSEMIGVCCQIHAKHTNRLCW